MVKKEVWFVMKDPGGTNNVLPVALFMRKKWGELCDIRVIADQSGKAEEIIRKAEVGDYLNAYSMVDLQHLPRPEIVVTSMCSGESLGRSLVADFGLERKTFTIAMPDSPWGRYEKEWNDPQYYPTWLLVNDPSCSMNLQNIWRLYDAEKIKIFPWPFLDKYWKFDSSDAFGTVDEFCGYDRKSVISFLGQLDGTSEVLRETVMALNAINMPVNFVVRLHLRCSDREKEVCKKILKEFSSGRSIYTESPLDIATSTLIAGSDTVVSVYSLSLIEAAALRKQTISVITEAGYKMFRDDIGEKMIPDFGNAGYAYEVHNLAEFTIALQKAINGKLRRELLPKQKAALTVDGKNAERVANFIAHNILGI